MKLARVLPPLAVVLALVAPAAAPPARAQTPSLNQLGVARLNADAQVLWQQDGLPMARQAAQVQLQKLVGVEHTITGNAKAKIIAVNSITIDCPGAPGLTRLDASRIEGRLPLRGTWRVAANVRVNVKGKILFVPFDDTFNVEVELRNLVAGIRVDLDSSDPASPRIARVYPPAVAFSLKLTSANAVIQFVSFITPGLVNPLAQAVAKVGAVFLAQKLNLSLRGTPQIIGTGGPGLAPVAPANLEAAAVAIEQQARATKMPFGSIFEMRYRDPYTGTWEASLNDPSFRLVPDGYESIFDSTTNTGEYLAGQAYRYGTTRSPATLAEIRQTLAATRILLTMKGQPGNLNRLIMPLAEFVSRFGQPTGDKYAIRFQGVDYVASDYISRDCYFGMLFGLSTTYDLVPDAGVRAEARAQLEMAIDYLLANNWTWRKKDGSFGERWQGVLEQQYAWLLAAARMNPAKYSAVLDQYRGFADILWTGFWIAVMDPYYSYYKFELGGGSLHTVLRLETDPVRWQRSYQGMAIMRRHIGHHQNALFNGFYYAADPSAKAALGAENRNLLTRFLRGPRRKIVVDLTGDPTIEKTTYTLPIDPNILYPDPNPSPQTIPVAKYPIPMEKRTSAGFAWSVSPFRLTPGYPIGPNPHGEGESYDLLLPYWMARYHGAIAAPRPTPTGVSATTATATATGVR